MVVRTVRCPDQMGSMFEAGLCVDLPMSLLVEDIEKALSLYVIQEVEEALLKIINWVVS